MTHDTERPPPNWASGEGLGNNIILLDGRRRSQHGRPAHTRLNSDARPPHPDARQPLPASDAKLLRDLVDLANREFDGHLTILKFTCGWRIQLGTPDEFNQFGVGTTAYRAIKTMPSGATFCDAALAAVAVALRVIHERRKTSDE